MTDRYHHGDLRGAVLRRAAEVIAAEGPSRFSLRSLATDLGVSHTAPRHHFGSREGVLNALAVEGFELLADRLRDVAAADEEHRFLEMGVAYVTFATTHPAHFSIMFGPDVRDGEDPDVMAAGRTALSVLREQVVRTGTTAGQLEADGVGQAAVAASTAGAWALVHGLATLAHTGALRLSGLAEPFGGDLAELVRATVGTASFGGADSAGPDGPMGS